MLLKGDPHISIHAPLAGCDGRTKGESRANEHFNPRTPCGVRPDRKAGGAAGINFNPRTPCGVRPGRYEPCHQLFPFQSTHPLRGATFDHCVIIASVYISIHAPLAGCDNQRHPHAVAVYDFNPRTPCGVRPPAPAVDMSQFVFQSTHPLRGATTMLPSSVTGLVISIHAPLAGCDSAKQQ